MNEYNNVSTIQDRLKLLENSFHKPNNSIVRVNGYDGAKSYVMPYNSAVILLDANDDIFYIKMSDDLGKTTIHSYKYEEIPEPEPINTNNFVTKKEFSMLDEKLNQLISLANKGDVK